MKKDIKKYLPWIILLILVFSLSLWYTLSKRITQEQILLYEAKLSQAEAHVEARQYTMAMQKCYEAVDTIPSEVGAYEGIVHVLITKNRLKDAQDVIKQSAKAISNYDKSILYKMLGDEYYELKEYSKAYDMYDAGSFFGINNMGLELMLGKTYLKLGDINNAKKQFNKSGYTGDTLEETNLLLAYIDAIDGTERAKSTLNSVTAQGSMKMYYEEFSSTLNSLDEDKKFNATKLARVYINNGYPYLAILTLQPMKEDISEYLEGMYFLGRAYYEYGQYDQAIEALDGALVLGGMEQEIFWTKARSYFLTNDLENSINSYISAIGHTEVVLPSDLVMEYVKLLLEDGRLLKASDLIKGLFLLEGDKPYFNLQALEVNYELNQDMKVDFYLNQLEEMQLSKSEEQEYLRWRILTILEEDSEEYMESKDEVAEYMDRLFKLDRFSPHYRLFFAKIQIEEGKEDLAVQSLQQAIEYDLDYTVTEEALKLLSSL
jgi:tetratricopeptide (TPR) repeat protein